MPRKLKTYQTSLGFFDLAIAVPSMKAALEAWGAKSNLFHQGFAREVDDPEVVAATVSKPGVILRRPVGSEGPFKEEAALPDDLSSGEANVRPTRHRAKSSTRPAHKIGDMEARKAALAYEKEQKQRESERRKEETARAKEREHQEHAVAKAKAAIEKAKQAHEERAIKLEAERTAVEKRSMAEDARWEKQKAKMEIALRRARGA